jgi:fatty acid desaturase
MPDSGIAPDKDSTSGDEFRVDRRRAKGLPPAEIKRLTRLDPVKSTVAIAQTWLTLALAIGLAGYLWTWWAVLLALPVIAVNQHALFVLAHDGAHYRLYKTRWLNDLVGRICASAAGISMCGYRVVHRLHHNHLYERIDPDTAIHGGYPRGKAYLYKKLAKDLIGLTAHKNYAYFFGAPAMGQRADGTDPLGDTSPELRRAALTDRWMMVALQIVLPIAAFLLGFGWQYLVLWVLPLLTLIQPILRFRAILEHGGVTDFGSPLTAARTNLPPWWLRWLFPHHVNYHIEHHLYPSIPHYNLPAAHRAMREHGVLEGAEVKNTLDAIKVVVAERKAA